MHFAGVAAALTDHCGQCFFDAKKLGNAFAYDGQFLGPQSLGLPAMAPILERKQVRDFVQTEAQGLRLLDEA